MNAVLAKPIPHNLVYSDQSVDLRQMATAALLVRLPS
jgi:hypothetical protein